MNAKIAPDAEAIQPPAPGASFCFTYSSVK